MLGLRISMQRLKRYIFKITQRLIDWFFPSAVAEPCDAAKWKR